MATIRVSEEIQHGSYRLRKSPATLYPFEVHLNLFTLSHIFTWSLQLCYTAALVRLIYQIQQEDTSSSQWRIYVALLSDVFLQVPGAVVAFTIILALCTRNPTLPRPEYRLEGDEAPSVDVMITCCGEQAEILINTVAAAAAQSYPRGRFRVFVLDDGHDAELKSAVEMLDKRLRSQGAGAPVIYLSRTVPRGQPSYFKCGNLRYGMEESQGLGSGSELVAGLDADMIPEPDWLRTMVPHLLLQDTVAMAVCPQTYYNVPPDDPLGQKADFDAYFTVQELLNDRLGACMCTGTGYVAKRKAIADIGGWPLAFSGEDYMCSVFLTGAGWEIAFERRALQKGLTPESLPAAMRQRMRWADGGIEVHERLTAFLPTSTLASRMRLPIRIVNMGYVVRDYSPILTVLAMLFLPLALMPTTTSTDGDIFQSIALKHRPYLVMTQKLFFVTHLAQVFHGYYTYYHLDPAVVANTSANGLWSSPCKL
ncbi:MAG: hypothetical protein Q9228_006964 [Teloschistes exilis]